MKISHLQENLTPSSAPSAPVPGPKFGRSDEMLESGTGSSASTTTAGVIATGTGEQRKGKKSIFQGIKNAGGFANSRKAGISEDAINEDDLSEEQLQAKKRREELFKRSKDRDIGNKPKSRDIMAKEEFNGGGEYNDEIDMVQNNLHTIVRVSTHLGKELKANENMPEWVQEKIAVAKSMIVTVMDYMISQHERGNVYTQDMMAEGGAKDRQWSNKDMERLRVATRDFDDIMASDGPEATKQNLIKKRIQTKPMAGPKGVLPEQGVAEGSMYGDEEVSWEKGGTRAPTGAFRNPAAKKVVFSGTGADGGKYEVIQSGSDDYMIHANGKHIDTYPSLQRAISVLQNEVSGLKKTVDEESKGLWPNIHAKRERIKQGSGERMRKPGSKGAPTADALRKSAK